MTNKVTIIAIDRAEAEIGRASKKLANELEIEIKAYTLVNHSFRNTPAYKGDETKGYFEEVLCDFNDTEELIKILDEIAHGTKVVLHCRMEEAIKDYQKVIPLIPNAIVQTVESLTLSTEKYRMREAMTEKYPEICPKYVHLESYNDFSETMIANFTFPVIVKPNGLHSSFFVKKCNNLDEVHNALRNAFAGLQEVYAREYGTGTPSLLVEEFINGKMYSIDAYTRDLGKIWLLPPVKVTIAAELGLDGYYGYQYDLPSDLSDNDIADANECTRKAIDALGLMSSVAHVELYKTQNGWKIIEVAPRIGGYRQELYMEAYGIDHYYNDLLLHLGKDPEVTPKWHKHASGLTIYADLEGTITAINGVDEAKKLESVVSVGVDTAVGRRAIFASNGGQLLAIIIMSNLNKEILHSEITQVRNLIQFEIESN